MNDACNHGTLNLFYCMIWLFALNSCPIRPVLSASHPVLKSCSLLIVAKAHLTTDRPMKHLRFHPLPNPPLVNPKLKPLCLQFMSTLTQLQTVLVSPVELLLGGLQRDYRLIKVSVCALLKLATVKQSGEFCCTTASKEFLPARFGTWAGD